MTTLTQSDEQRVKEKYPDAVASWTSRGWRILFNESPGMGVQIIGRTESAHVPESEAWADAASRLPKAEDDPICQLPSCGHPLSMHNDSEGCCTAPSDFSQKNYGGEIGVQPTPCICSKFRSTSEPAPQTFEHPVDELAQRVIDENPSTSMSAAYRHVAKGLYDAINPIGRNAAKASSPVVAGGEGEYAQGFNDCRERAMRIVDESEGYLSQIEALRPPTNGANNG